jgi:RNA polymerase sigma factor (sigma-70 family)
MKQPPFLAPRPAGDSFSAGTPPRAGGDLVGTPTSVPGNAAAFSSDVVVPLPQGPAPGAAVAAAAATAGAPALAPRAAALTLVALESARSGPLALPADRDDLSVCSTVDLLERARDGNEVAWEVVFRRCVRGLRRFAVGRLPNQCRGMNDTEDLVQDTVIRALSHLDQFESRHEGALLAYLRQSLLNRIVDEVRKTSRRPLAVALAEEHVDGGASPLEAAIGRQNVERYEIALAQLRPRDREAILLRLEQQLSYEDLAVQLGMPSSNAARVAVKRALYRLAQEMAVEVPGVRADC